MVVVMLNVINNDHMTELIRCKTVAESEGQQIATRACVIECTQPNSNKH